MIQTYKDSAGNIYTETGEKIPDLATYSAKVRTGEISGKPLDISQMPAIQRTNDGGIAKQANALSQLGSLDKFKSNSTFLNAVKDIIQKKQSIMQPLTEQKAFWRTLQSSTTPFGGAIDTTTTSSVGQFTDERFREMSPSDQASIQASRDAAVSAHLRGISEEEKYRGTRVDDTINALKDLLVERDKIADEEANKSENALNELIKKRNANLPVTDEDYRKAGYDSVDGRLGGSVSWRNNNPLNIKYANQSNAKQGTKAQDGGYFATFNTYEDGLKEAVNMLTNPKTYGNLTLDQALKVWSGGVSTKPTAQDKTGFNTWLGKRYFNEKGYDSSIVGGYSARTSDMTTEELNDLVSAMQNREGWKEGTYEQGTPTKFTNVQNQKLKAAGLENATEDEKLAYLYPEKVEKTIIDEAVKNIKPNQYIAMGITDKNVISDIIELKYNQGVSDEDILSMLTELGLPTKTRDSSYTIPEYIEIFIINPIE